MDTQEKMFYTRQEASSYLGIGDDVLTKWINRLHITRPEAIEVLDALSHLTGETFDLSTVDVDLLE